MIRASLICASFAAAAAIAAPSASAADKIYWGNDQANGVVGFVGLDGSGGGSVGAGTGTDPFGVGFDPAAGKIYWTSSNIGGTHQNKIYVANVNGSDAAALATGTATVNDPEGIVVDAASGKLYWANSNDGISYANLNGSGGANLSTGAATAVTPQGVTLDPTTGRIYWANEGGNKISYANLNGSGGGNLLTGAATVNGPAGVAIDPANGRIYWANRAGNKISYANLNGSGGGDLPTGTATVNAPDGVAIDPGAGRIYWGNYSANKISYANLDGAGGGNLPTGSAPVSQPNMPALLEVPSGTKAPAVRGSARPGSRLTCTQGTWDGDLIQAHLYRAPRTFSYAWTDNGSPVAGATSRRITATFAGKYGCSETATNAAGSTTQTSARHTIASPSGKPKIVGAKVSQKKLTAKFTFKRAGVPRFQCALVKRPASHHKTPKPHFSSCKSPKTYKHLKPGKYKFEVRALNIAGPGTPATKNFKIA